MSSSRESPLNGRGPCLGLVARLAGPLAASRISRSRIYQRLADKKQAVADILNIGDYPAFLAKSGYAQKMVAR